MPENSLSEELRKHIRSKKAAEKVKAEEDADSGSSSAEKAVSEKLEKKAIEPTACADWSKVINAWKVALKWRKSMEDAFATMNAVALSTEQVGTQLFLMTVGEAGSAKTRMCEGMLVSQYCHALEHLTGFHSGYMGPEGGDYSLLTRINKKTLITPEADVMMSSPKFGELMSQQRRIFDGTSGATYKNRNEDIHYTGLRTPWVMAGTPAMLDSNQSHLGDRFLKVFIDPPTPDEERDILRKCGYTALRSVLMTSNGNPEGTVEENLCLAYKLTGGYINYLREEASNLLPCVSLDEDSVVDYCSLLAEFTAYFRTQQYTGKHRNNEQHSHRENHTTKELPTRLTEQYVRLSVCLAAVMQTYEVNAEVLRRVKKVALNTSSGITLGIVRRMYDLGEGSTVGSVAIASSQTEDRVRSILRFLRSLGAVIDYKENRGTGTVTKWKLTDKVKSLCDEVLNA